jgi:hypothetical protein
MLTEAGLVTAALGAVGLAIACLGIFAGVLRIAAPGLFARLWALRRATIDTSVGGS